MMVAEIILQDPETTDIKAVSEDAFDYEEAVKKFASGRYQIFLQVLLVLTAIPAVFNNNGYIFIGANQVHTCQVPDHVLALTNSSRVDVTYKADKCTYSVLVNKTIFSETKIACTKWNYDQTYFQSTITSEWNLNDCKDKWLIAVATSMYMLGFFIGCLVLGDLSDRFGRKLIIVASSGFMVIAGVVASFSVNIEMLISARFVLGFFTAGARNSGFAYLSEITSQRATAAMVVGSVYALGGILVTGISHLIPNWRYFQLVCACCFIIYIPYYWLMPESPKWLLAKGKLSLVEEYFKRSARLNGVTIPENFSILMKTQVNRDTSLLTLFRTPNLRKLTLSCCFLWLNVSSIYFAMQYNIGNITGSIFTNNYLMQGIGVLEMLCICILSKGRKPVLVVGFALATVFAASIHLSEHYGEKIGTIIIAILGKFMVQVIFDALYITVSEIFPTTIRTTAIGFGSAFARIGGAISPYLVLTHDLWPNTPYIIFAGMSLLSTIVALLLPESVGRKLPDTAQEAEELYNIGFPKLCKSKKEDENDTELKNTEPA